MLNTSSIRELQHAMFILFTDVDECELQPCMNGGTCNNVNGDYECRCSDGWTGKNCSIGMTCNNVNGDYECICSDGWMCKNCDVGKSSNNVNGDYEC